MKKHNKRSAFSLMEMSITTGITAVVIGTTCGVTLVCAKLTRSAASLSASGNSGQQGIQRILQDVGDADAVLTDFTMSGSGVKGGSTGYKSSPTDLVLRVPSVDAAGRPLVGQYQVVHYFVGAGGGDSFLFRCSSTVVKGTVVNSSTKLVRIAPALQVTFAYSGKAAASGGVIKGVVSTVTNLTTGLFDGQVTVNPATVVLTPNVSGSIFVNVDLIAKDKTGKQEFYSGAKLRNSVL